MPNDKVSIVAVADRIFISGIILTKSIWSSGRLGYLTRWSM
jgi:hypothetical protein